MTKKNKYRLRYTAFAGTPLALALACAADGAISAEENVPTLEQVNVVGKAPEPDGETVGYTAKSIRSATKTETPLIDIPQSITVVTQELIKDQNMQSIADSVRYVPGVEMSQGEGNRDAVIFRGNLTTGDLYVDGIRDDVQYFRDLYNIERVEVLKGPNAMIFGRGAAGGLINRVTKQANWENPREASFQIGSWDTFRLTGDFGQAINDYFAVRLTSLWESSRSFREGFHAERWGVNPTIAWRLGDQTRVVLGYERFEDDRVADRGIPSFSGRPIDTHVSTFFGDPRRSPTWVDVDAFSALIDHDFGNGIKFRNRTRYAIYDKFYQNIFPGDVNATGTEISISAYNNATQRDNFFNQTDLTFELETGPLKHTVLTGAEFGYQETDNLRQTGFFTGIGPNVTSVRVPVSEPRFTGPIVFRRRASDAYNHGLATISAGYFQDQIEITKHWQLVAGLRYDNFEVEFRDKRNGQTFYSNDDLWSPRGGLIFKPIESLSIYASYSIAYVPRAGDQLASLTLSIESLKPEEFKNYEVGAKWDIFPNLSATLAFYQLDRLNVAVTDPNDPTVSFLVDGQRTRGIELGLAGEITDQWRVIGGYSYQDAEITESLSADAPKGNKVAQVPEHTFSVWNRYDITPHWGVGLGAVYRSEMFASTDNTVRLPGFLRFDGAVYYTVNDNVQLQVNVENLFDKEYYASAHNNNNIMPGSPIAANAVLRVRF